MCHHITQPEVRSCIRDLELQEYLSGFSSGRIREVKSPLQNHDKYDAVEMQLWRSRVALVNPEHMLSLCL